MKPFLDRSLPTSLNPGAEHARVPVARPPQANGRSVLGNSSPVESSGSPASFATA